jgi:hypothetical protein
MISNRYVFRHEAGPVTQAIVNEGFPNGAGTPIHVSACGLVEVVTDSFASAMRYLRVIAKSTELNEFRWTYLRDHGPLV